MNNLYEQKYKEALGWMQKLYDGLSGATKEDAEHYFPELKENEDEKIRRQIINFLKEFECDHYRNLDFSSWLAWLEKQGESKIVWHNLSEEEPDEDVELLCEYIGGCVWHDVAFYKKDTKDFWCEDRQIKNVVRWARLE